MPPVDSIDADIFPINHLVKDRLVYFRSAPSTKIITPRTLTGVRFATEPSRRQTR